MSTRGHICIKLKDEDLDKELHMKDINGNDLECCVYTKKEFPYMFVYNHHDSYFDGLGKNLITNLQNYDSVKNYILQGDRSTFDTPYTECGEYPEDLKPHFSSNIDGPIPEEYFYLFNDNQWFMTRTSGKELAPISEKFEDKLYLFTIKDLETIKFLIDRYWKTNAAIEKIIGDYDSDKAIIYDSLIRKFEHKIKDLCK